MDAYSPNGQAGGLDFFSKDGIVGALFKLGRKDLVKQRVRVDASTVRMDNALEVNAAVSIQLLTDEAIDALLANEMVRIAGTGA